MERSERALGENHRRTLMAPNDFMLDRQEELEWAVSTAAREAVAWEVRRASLE